MGGSAALHPPPARHPRPGNPSLGGKRRQAPSARQLDSATSMFYVCSNVARGRPHRSRAPDAGGHGRLRPWPGHGVRRGGEGRARHGSEPRVPRRLPQVRLRGPHGHPAVRDAAGGAEGSSRPGRRARRGPRRGVCGTRPVRAGAPRRRRAGARPRPRLRTRQPAEVPCALGVVARDAARLGDSLPADVSARVLPTLQGLLAQATADPPTREPAPSPAAGAAVLARPHQSDTRPSLLGSGATSLPRAGPRAPTPWPGSG
jgi:hypothetical protein